MQRWYVVHTKTRRELTALDHLRRQGFSAYLPQYRASRRHARRVEQVARPLFPRYLFVALDPEGAPWRAVNSTVGVSHVVCHGERPTPVPAGVVETIRAREDAAGMILLDATPELQPGDTVRIQDGPLGDLTGVFESRSDEERVTVLLTLMGRQVRVRVPAETVAVPA